MRSTKIYRDIVTGMRTVSIGYLLGRIDARSTATLNDVSYNSFGGNTISVVLPANIIEQRFDDLAEQWRRETRGMSTMIHKAMNSHYLDIIGMGPAAIPLILRDLEREPDHWFVALQHVTGRDPVPKEDRGNIEKMAAAWIEWGHREGWL